MNANCAKCSRENASFRCGACRQANYCSRECQSGHWAEHKPTCRSHQTVQVVVVDGAITRDQRMSRVEMDRLSWEECPVPKMLGVGLKVARLRPSGERHSREVGIFMMVDPKDGLAPSRWQIGPLQPSLGTLVFARTDCTDFTCELFWRLYDYIYGTLMDLYSDYGGVAARKKITPECFNTFVQTMENAGY